MKKFLYCIGLFIIGLSSPIQAEEYAAKDFSYLIGNTGFSDKLLQMHFTLYQGYVKHTNLLMQLIKEQDPKSYAYQALKRRFGWEFDGMRLHELYFENMGGKSPISSRSNLYKQIVRDFSSFEKWKADFVATGLMRGIGWSILYYDAKEKKLFNAWINEHDLGHLVEGEPFLVMDVWEHAYMPEFGLDRAQYIDTFFKTINWEVVQKRAEGQGIRKRSND